MDKKLPLRMCIVCREMVDKRDLIRVVRGKDGEIALDRTGKANGRGAYICNKDECVNKLKKTKALSRAFKTNVAESVYDSIIAEYSGERQE